MSLQVPNQQPGQQSLRKHRQTLLPDAQKQKKDYGGLLTVPGNEQLPSVGLRDKEKVGNLVKRRFSSRMPMQDVYDGPMPSLPTNAADMISHANQQNHHHHEGVPPPIMEQPTAPVNKDEFQMQPPQRSKYESREEPSRETLENPNFDAQRYISQNLSDASNVVISEFADKLSSMQSSLAAEKKEAMYKNYKTFLHVGKEISYLGTEVDTLRKLLNDLHSATSAMKEDADNVLATEGTKHTRNLSQNSGNSGNSLAVPEPRGGGGSSGGHAKRSSMIFLEEDYGKQLASLYRHVEGARQYLPNSQGRRVVKESGGWYQLNNATWKPFQPVSLFLLNDHLLVATKKRVRHGETLTASGNTSSSRLIASECWPLSEIEVNELVPKNARDVNAQNALCIKYGKVSFVYRADKSSTHNDFYPKLKQIKASLKKETGQGVRQHEHQARLRESMDYYAKQTPTLGSNMNLLETYSSARKTSAHSREVSMDITGRTKGLRELDEMVNDLDVKIAYRNFEECVGIIESNLKELGDQPNAKDTNAERMLAMNATSSLTNNLSAKDTVALTNQVFKMKLDQRAEQLTDILVHELSQGYLGRAQIEKNVFLLIKLSAGEQAKKTLLDSRRNMISRRIKQVEFQGDIPSYMTQIAIIYFRLIRSTVDIFNHCYQDKQNSSAIVEWAKSQVEQYILLFARQLYDIDPKDETYKICSRITKRESQQLKEVGLDLNFVLAEIFEPLNNS